jgi:PAS domain S-box-containing protein
MKNIEILANAFIEALLRKRVERELEERQVYLEGVLNAAPDAIITLDADHRVVEWNAGAERLFQYTAAEAIGRNLDDLVNAPQTVDEAVALTEKVLGREAVGPVETVRYRKDGSPVDVMLAGAPIVVGDELIGAVGIYTDITERVLAETALRELNLTLEDEVVAQMRAIRAEKEKTDTILRSVGDAIGVSSADLKIQYVNDAFTALTGYSAEEAIGQPSNFMLAKRLPEADWQAMQQALAAGEVWHGEAIFQRKDGRTYEAAVTIAPLLDAEDRLAGYISSHHDISRLKDLDRAKNQFITNISHELRTPTANIKLYTHLMQKDESGKRAARYFEVVRAQAERLENLIEDIVEITELDSGPIITTWETLNLASLVESRAVHYQPRAQAAGLTLKVAPIPPRLPAVKGDQARLSQALDKLIENGLVFTPHGGQVTLEVASTQVSDATWATITVRDTGPGISEEEQGRIFDRFYRGSLAESGHIPGTGLGLSVAQAIMQAHGGRVTVESTAGQGPQSWAEAQSSQSRAEAQSSQSRAEARGSQSRAEAQGSQAQGSTFTLWLKADAPPPGITHEIT